MSGKGTKYYVVWEGHDPGIYHSWAECKSQVDGYEGAKYKSFATRDEAEKAFEEGYYETMRKNNTKKTATPSGTSAYIIDSIAVDASCLGNPGVMEYRGVYVRTGKELFRIGPFEDGTNNIGEFLAIVHGLALLKKKNSPLPIYSDSISAIAWVRHKKCKTLLERTGRNDQIFELIARAEKWLAANHFITKIMKWDTQSWGEIPADFGRK